MVGTSADVGGRPCRRRSSSSPPSCWKDAAKSEVARDYDVSRTWVQQLVRRYEAEGNAAFAPRSRRPHHNPRAVPIEVEDTIRKSRTTLTLDAVTYNAPIAANQFTIQALRRDF